MTGGFGGNKEALSIVEGTSYFFILFFFSFMTSMFYAKILLWHVVMLLYKQKHMLSKEFERFGTE